MSNRHIVTFKSTNDNYWKEKTGIKSNTLRKIDEKDERIKLIREGKVDRIEIQHASIPSESFIRHISDTTQWDGYIIVSWIPELQR